MNPSLVTSPVLSKRLKELGVPQLSEFYWSEQLNRIITREEFLSYDPFNPELLQDDGFREAVDRTYSVYLAGELGEMLPVNCSIGKMAKHFYCSIPGIICPGIICDSVEGTMAESMGKTLAYLLENNLLTLTK